MQILRRGNCQPMPNINPPIRRKPFNAIGLARVIPALRAIVFGIYWQYELGGILPPPKGAVLLNMIQLESLDPLSVNRAPHVSLNHGNIAKGFPPRIRVYHNISPDYERGINRHRCTLAVSGESHLDRVQVNVAALKGKEEEEAN